MLQSNIRDSRRERGDLMPTRWECKSLQPSCKAACIMNHNIVNTLTFGLLASLCLKTTLYVHSIIHQVFTEQLSKARHCWRS